MKPASEEDFIVTSTADLPIPLTIGADDRELVAFMALLALIGLWVVFANLRKMYQTRQREKTRREIAAYVAEGSISPADARTMMGSEESEFDKKIADAVAWGMLSSKKAEQLLRAMREDRESRERSRVGA